MTRRRTAALVLAGVAALAVAAVQGLGPGRSGAVASTSVRRGPFLRRVAAEGNLKAARATPLSSPGQELTLKIAWLADDGTAVKAGDVVARFDATETEKKLVEGKESRSTTTHRTGKTKAEADAALFGLDEDRTQARREFDAARSFQRKDPEIFSRREIIEADIDVDVAAAREEQAIRSRSSREKLARADLDLLSIDSRKADYRITRASEELRALELRAPHDGFVVLTRDWRGELPAIGQSVWSGFKLGEIPDVASMEAEVWVLEADAGGLAVGRPAEIIVESMPGVILKGTTKRVDGVPRQRVRGVPVQYYGVTVSIPAVPAEARTRMKPGQRVQATLLLDERADALTVPRQAVFERDGKIVVFRRSLGRWTPGEVALGPAALGRVVVEKELAEGDVVALVDPEKPAVAPAGSSASPGARP